MVLEYLFFWNYKTNADNSWRPEPGQNPTQYIDNLPATLKRTDLEATAVDVAPIVVGAGGFAHLLQLPHFGFTSPMSIFRNVRTMTAMHRTVLFVTPVVLACQAAGIEYRYFIPRWSHERELRRDEEEVRQHVDVGMAIGSMSWASRMVFRIGARYWAPIDIILGGALADLMDREDRKAHGF